MCKICQLRVLLCQLLKATIVPGTACGHKPPVRPTVRFKFKSFSPHKWSQHLRGQKSLSTQYETSFVKRREPKITVWGKNKLDQEWESTHAKKNVAIFEEMTE